MVLFYVCNCTRGEDGVFYSRIRNGAVHIFYPMEHYVVLIFTIFICIGLNAGPIILLRYALSLAGHQGLSSGRLGPVVGTYFILLMVILSIQLLIMVSIKSLRGFSIKVDRRKVCIQSYLSILPTSRQAALGIILYQQTINLDDITNVCICKEYYMRIGYDGNLSSPENILQVDRVNHSKSICQKTIKVTLNPKMPETVLKALVQYIYIAKQGQLDQLGNFNNVDGFLSAMQPTVDIEPQDYSQRYSELRKHYTIYYKDKSTKIKLFQIFSNEEFRFWLILSKFYQIAFVVYLVVIGASVARHIQLYGVSNKIIGYIGIIIPLFFVCIIYSCDKALTHSFPGYFDTLTLYKHSMEVSNCFGRVIEIKYQTVVSLNSKQDAIINMYSDEAQPGDSKLIIFFCDVQGMHACSYSSRKVKTVSISTGAMLLNEIQEIEQIVRQKIYTSMVPHSQQSIKSDEFNSSVRKCTQYT